MPSAIVTRFLADMCFLYKGLLITARTWCDCSRRMVRPQKRRQTFDQRYVGVKGSTGGVEMGHWSRLRTLCLCEVNEA